MNHPIISTKTATLAKITFYYKKHCMNHPIISAKTATLALLRSLIASFEVQASIKGLALRSPTLLSITPKTPKGEEGSRCPGLNRRPRHSFTPHLTGGLDCIFIHQKMDTLVSRSGQELLSRPRSCPSFGILTVIRDSFTRYRVNGQGLTTYQWRALPTELHRLITSIVTVRFYDQRVIPTKTATSA